MDTIARTAANASVKCTTAATRNIFEDCLFPVYATAATPLVFDMSATGSIDRYLLIRNSIIINSGSSTLTAVIASTASPGGVAVFDNNTVVGAANYAASATDATVKVAGPVPNGHTSGVALSSSTS